MWNFKILAIDSIPNQTENVILALFSICVSEDTSRIMHFKYQAEFIKITYKLKYYFLYNQMIRIFSLENTEKDMAIFNQYFTSGRSSEPEVQLYRWKSQASKINGRVWLV